MRGSRLGVNGDKALEKVETEFTVRDQRMTGKGLKFFCASTRNMEVRFERLRENLKEIDYVPYLGKEKGEVTITVKRLTKKGSGGGNPMHVVLFFATLLTTMTAGALMFNVDVLDNPLAIWKGWPFSLAIMLILGMHELGHYLMSKKRGVVATLPYFIPVPPPFILGTLGAVIRMKSPMPDRKSMFDIGVAGPLMGIVFAIPVTILGLYLSPIPLPEKAIAFRVGRPLIYWALSSLIPVGEGGLHPVAFAGWVGFFVTFLNLLPVGQLDGGHIFRAMFGEAHAKISGTVPIFLLMMGFFLTFFLGANGSIWIFWGFIGMFFHGAGHPPPMNDIKPLDVKRRVIGILVVLLMISCFTPVPFSVTAG